MSKATRYFLIGAAVIVLLGLGTGLVAYYNGNLPIGVGKGADAELAYLPANATAVGYADVRTIMTSEFSQKIRQLLPTGEEKAKLQAELGVDVEKDIDSVATAYLGGPSPLHGALVVVRGRFDQGQIEAKATEHGAIPTEYGGKRILTMKPDETHAHDGPRPAGGVAFLEQGVLAFGELETLKLAIDAGASGNDVRKNSELMAIINDVQSTGNAWFVGKFNALTSQSGLPQEIQAHIPPIDMFAVSVQVNGGVRGAVRADARDEKAAEQLRDVVRGALAAGKLVSGKNQQMDAMLNSLQITGSGKTVGITFNLPAELLDVLNGLAAAHGLTHNPSAIRK